MSRAEVLSELAEKLEVSRPRFCKSFDADIYEALGFEVTRSAVESKIPWRFKGIGHPTLAVGLRTVERWEAQLDFTRKLGDAVKLLPECVRKKVVMLQPNGRVLVSISDANGIGQTASAETEELATCAAALKMRARL